MESITLYLISLRLIIVYLAVGIGLFILSFIALNEAPFVSILIMAFSLFIMALSIYLWRKRKEGLGYYWDEEGVVTDLKGAKICWNDIRDIQFHESTTVFFSKSTVVYPHYTHHENIRIRRKKWLPTEAHSIDWIVLEKSKEFHENLMKKWEEKKH